MNPYSPKKLKLSNLKAFSPQNSVKQSRKEVHVVAHIIADNDIALVYAFSPKNYHAEPFTLYAKNAIEEAMGTEKTNKLVEAGFFACVYRVKDKNSDIPLRNTKNWDYKAYVARGQDYYKHPDDLKTLVRTFCSVSFCIFTVGNF